MKKIVENYSDSSHWYRKYEDNFIEQGGTIITSISVGGSYTLTFPVSFTSTPINIRTTVYRPRNGDSAGSALTLKTGTLTSTEAVFMNDGSNAKAGFYWEACGY